MLKLTAPGFREGIISPLSERRDSFVTPRFQTPSVPFVYQLSCFTSPLAEQCFHSSVTRGGLCTSRRKQFSFAGEPFLHAVIISLRDDVLNVELWQSDCFLHILQGLESPGCHVDHSVDTLSSKQIGQTVPGVTLIRRKALHQ